MQKGKINTEAIIMKKTFLYLALTALLGMYACDTDAGSGNPGSSTRNEGDATHGDPGQNSGQDAATGTNTDQAGTDQSGTGGSDNNRTGNRDTSSVNPQ